MCVCDETVKVNSALCEEYKKWVQVDVEYADGGVE